VEFKIFFVILQQLRISGSMSKYVYQIQGALENPPGSLKGLRVLVCDLYNFDSADAPISIIDKETVRYLEFRLKLSEDALNIQNLPVGIQNKIRVPLGKWLDQWVLENFYGNTSDRKGVNP
jgi:hypothetical protein